MKACIICNPASGSYNQDAINIILDELAGKGFECTLLNTRKAGDATRLAEQNGSLFDLVIACGGDGTINEVINGLHAGATLAIIPMGSANVLANELGLLTVEQACSAIVRGQVRSMSLGLLEAEGIHRRFFLMAGFGADGQSVENLQLAEKKDMGRWAYIISAIRLLWNWDLSLAEAGADSMATLFHTMMVCNSSHYGGSFIMAHNTTIFEPRFEVIYTLTNSRREFLAMSMRLIFSRKQKHSFMASRVEVKGRKAIQADGEFIGYSPARVEMLPDFLNIIC